MAAQGPAALVFRPMGNIRWPEHCVACFAEDPPDSVTLDVYAATTMSAVTKVVGLGGGLVGELTKAAAGTGATSPAGEVQRYRVPICASCKSRLSDEEVSGLESSSKEVSTSILRRDARRLCVTLTFQNAAYAAAFRSANTGLIYDSEEACMGKSPCKQCGRMVPDGELFCPHCGRPQWGMLIFLLLVGLALVGAGIAFCDPGGWRWLWCILGAIVTTWSISGLVKGIRWSNRPR